jgi:hypothetical protein
MENQQLILSYNETKSAWHYDDNYCTVENTNAGWVDISDRVSQIQLHLFTFYIDYKYFGKFGKVIIKKYPTERIKEDWQRFKEWFHWFEACGIINTKAYHMANYDQLEEVFLKIALVSSGQLVE